MDHQLLFHREAPGTVRTSEGYALRWSGTAIMGILNVTPDSFSDGGRYMQIERAVSHAREMLEQGALILDIGGESTRPGAEPVPAHEELDRVLPVIRLLAEGTNALISIDTVKPEVAHESLKAGAHLVNDVTGLRKADMRAVCAEAKVPAVIMHMQGEPRTMQLEPSYQDVTKEVTTFLSEQAIKVLNDGVPSVMLDPGFGFGKTTEHNLQLVRELGQLVEIGYPVLLGASRKRTIGKLAKVSESDSRDPGSVALHLYGAARGAAMIRVHNVYAHQQALTVWQAVASNEHE